MLSKTSTTNRDFAYKIAIFGINPEQMPSSGIANYYENLLDLIGYPMQTTKSHQK